LARLDIAAISLSRLRHDLCRKRHIDLSGDVSLLRPGLGKLAGTHGSDLLSVVSLCPLLSQDSGIELNDIMRRAADGTAADGTSGPHATMTLRSG
jgi:hypothetical protein